MLKRFKFEALLLSLEKKTIQFMVILQNIWYNYYIVTSLLSMHQGMEATLITNKPNK